MQIVFIAHHLFQEGDAYGLIYALHLNRAFEDPEVDLYALFYVDLMAYLENKDGYADRVDRRLGYFSSFDLLKGRVRLVWCHFRSFVRGGISIGPCKQNYLGGKQKRNDIEIHADVEIFRNNPRSVSLYLNNADFDPAHKREELIKEVYAIHPERFGTTADGLRGANARVFDACLLRALEADGHGSERLKKSTIRHDYIDLSTRYVSRSVKAHGFVAVTKALRELVLSATRAYTEDNLEFLDTFITGLMDHYVKVKRNKEHYQFHSFKSKEDRRDFVIVLFWIRGAKKDELDAIHGRGGSEGKPQHHTNLTLYKFVRSQLTALGAAIDRPFIIVPIGDKLTEVIDEGVQQTYVKGSKKTNLIEFYLQPTFKGKPMGAQINFLLQLSLKYQVVQVGMRSGSMERLMYLGVPTVYFDRTQDVYSKVIEGGPRSEALVRNLYLDQPSIAFDPESKMAKYPGPVGATRIRNLCAFQGTTCLALLKYLGDLTSAIQIYQCRLDGGFPLFFQVESRDTGFLKYSSESDVKVGKKIEMLMDGFELQEYNDFKKRLVLEKGYLRKNIDKLSRSLLMVGSLSEQEEFKFCVMLWYISETYPYFEGLYQRNGSNSNVVVELGSSPFARSLRVQQRLKSFEDDELRRQRKARKDKQDEDDDIDYHTTLFGEDF